MAITEKQFNDLATRLIGDRNYYVGDFKRDIGIQFDPEPVDKTAGEKIARENIIPFDGKILFKGTLKTYMQTRPLDCNAESENIVREVGAMIDAALLADRQARKPSQPALDMAEEMIRGDSNGILFGKIGHECRLQLSVYDDAKATVLKLRQIFAEALELAKGGEANVDWKELEKDLMGFLYKIFRTAAAGATGITWTLLNSEIPKFFRSKSELSKA